MLNSLNQFPNFRTLNIFIRTKSGPDRAVHIVTIPESGPVLSCVLQAKVHGPTEFNGTATEDEVLN